MGPNRLSLVYGEWQNLKMKRTFSHAKTVKLDKTLHMTCGAYVNKFVVIKINPNEIWFCRSI